MPKKILILFVTILMTSIASAQTGNDVLAFVPNVNSDFRQIPNPGIDKKTSNIIGRKGADREVWVVKGSELIKK